MADELDPIYLKAFRKRDERNARRGRNVIPLKKSHPELSDPPLHEPTLQQMHYLSQRTGSDARATEYSRRMEAHNARRERYYAGLKAKGNGKSEPEQGTGASERGPTAAAARTRRGWTATA